MKRFRITIAVLTLAIFAATVAVSAITFLKSDEPEVVSVVKAADSEDEQLRNRLRRFQRKYFYAR